jgi:purine nucleoside phosphorylase
MRFAIIGGSSLTSFDPTNEFAVIGLKIASINEVVETTDYGEVHLRVIELRGDGIEHTIIFMQRHSHSGGADISHTVTPPHRINHRANIKALEKQKVDFILATASVGTIPPCFPPGRVGVARQYIDFTGVAMTYGEDNAKFTSMTQPFSPKVNAALLKTLRREQKVPEDVQLEFVFWLTQGPNYETEAEVNAIERMGGEVCGMTAPREAKLAAELGIEYSVLTIASNWAAGRNPADKTAALHHSEVSEVSKGTTGVIVACMIDLIKSGY